MRVSRAAEAVLLETTRLQAGACSDLCLTFSADGSRLAGMQWDLETVHVWETATRKRLAVITEDCLSPIAFHPVNDWFATATEEALAIWAVASGERIARLAWEEPFAWPSRLQFAGNGRELIVLGSDGLGVWDVLANVVSARYPLGPKDIGQEFLQWDGGLSVFTHYRPGGWSGEPGTDTPYHFSRIDFSGGARRYAVPMAGTPSYYSPDRHWVALCTEVITGRLEVWNTLEGRRYAVIQERMEGLLSRAAFSAAGRYLAQANGAGKSLTVWDGRTGAIANHLEMGGCYPAIAFSPTHRLLAVVMNRPEESLDQTLFLDPLTGVALGRAQGHPLPSGNHIFSPCGRWFASAMTDNTVGYACHPDPSGTVYLTDLTPILPLTQKWERPAE